eukprot:5925644-Amphidinium_carterae.2
MEHEREPAHKYTTSKNATRNDAIWISHPLVPLVRAAGDVAGHHPVFATLSVVLEHVWVRRSMRTRKSITPEKTKQLAVECHECDSFTEWCRVAETSLAAV